MTTVLQPELAFAVQRPLTYYFVVQTPSNWWSDFGSNTFFMLLGGAISFHATIIFERYKQFGETLRDIADARIRAEGYPISPKDLERAHEKSLEYWRFLEGKQWSLDAQGQHKAAARVGRLVSFTYRTTACIERMMKDQKAGNSINVYLMAFQSEFGQIKTEEFTRFEETVKPNIWVLLRPLPQSILPRKRETMLVNFFDKLL